MELGKLRSMPLLVIPGTSVFQFIVLNMSSHSTQRFDPPTSGLNIIPFSIMAGGWLAPLIMFWLIVWGPMRPFDYPSGDLMPGVWY